MSHIVHFEIHASDPAKLGEFYTKAFGWQITHIPALDYYLIATGQDGIGGGMPKRMGPKPAPDAPVSAFVCSLGVASVDAALKKALDAGATVALPKMAIPGVGYQVYVKDPDGNILGLHQPDTSAK